MLNKEDLEISGCLDNIRGKGVNKVIKLLIHCLDKDIYINTSSAREVLKSNRLMLIEKEPVKVKNEIKFLRTRKIPLTTARGKRFLLGISEDITDLYKVELALRKSEERYRTLFQNQYDGIIITSPLGIIEDWNRGAERLFGASKGQVLGNGIGKFLPSALVEKVKGYFVDRTQKSKDWNPEFTYICPNGGEIVSEVKVQPLKNDDDEVIGLIYVNRNITERKKAEQKIADQSRFLESINSNIPGVIYQLVQDQQGKFEFSYLSDGMELLIGKDSKLVRHIQWETLIDNYVHPDDINKLRNSMLASSKHLSPWWLQFRVKQSDYSYRWILGSSIPEKNTDGSITWSGLLTDISPLKKVEVALKESEHNYESLIDKLPAMVYQADTDCQLQLVYNSQKVFGLPADLLLAKGFKWRDIIHEEDKHWVYDEVQSMAGTRQTLIQKYRIVHNNKELWVRDYKTPQFDNNGSFVGVYGVMFNITRYVKKEKELHLKEKMYHLLAENSSNVVGLLDSDLHLTYISPSCYDLSGYGTSYFSSIGKVWAQIHPKDLINLKKRAVHDIKKCAIQSSFTHRIKTKTDTWIWVYTIVKYSYHNGKIQGVVFNTISIQDVKSQNELLQENQTRLLLALDAANQMTFEFDIKTRTYQWPDKTSNHKYAIDFKAITSGSEVLFHVHPDDRTKVKQNFNRAIKGQKAQPVDYRVIDDRGKVKYFRNYTKLIRNQEGDPGTLVGVIQDITKIKASDLKIEESEMKFRMLAENIDEPVYMRSETGLMYLSPAIYRLLDLNNGDKIENPFGLNYLHPEDSTFVKDQLKSFYDEPLNIQFRIKSKNGHVKWIWAKASSFKMKSGETRTIGILSDITAIKQMEAQLITEKNKAVSAKKARDEFLSMMSHELRTPMNTIINFEKLFSESLKAYVDSNQLADFQDSSRYLFKLLDDILYYSELISGDQEVDLEIFDLRDVVDEVLALVEPLYREKTLNVHIDYTLESCDVYTNRNYLFKILIYLVENAIKYTKEGSIQLHFYTQKDVLYIEIKDSGIGISKELLVTIFEPFFSGSSHLKKRHAGTGLGLAIVKILVEKLNGNVQVQSEVRVGSKFIVKLPSIIPKPGKVLLYFSTIATNYFLFKELYIPVGATSKYIMQLDELQNIKGHTDSLLIIDWDTVNLGSAEIKWLTHAVDKVFIITTQKNYQKKIPADWLVVPSPVDKKYFEDALRKNT